MRRRIRKKDIKKRILLVITILLSLFGFVAITYAIVMQIILCQEQYGAIIKGVFIADKSAWWFMGALAFIPTLFLVDRV